MIWLTSDYHFYHNKDFVYEARGFATVEEMNSAIVERHNSMVKPDDDVYVLGDLLMGGPDKLEDGLELISQLNGYLHLIRGNHDTNNRWEAYVKLPNFCERENSIYLDYQHYHFYLTHYPTITSNHDYDKPLRQRLLNICGHTHTKDKWCDWDKGYIYHVELDAHDCCPILLDDIITDFKDIYESNKTEDR